MYFFLLNKNMTSDTKIRGKTAPFTREELEHIAKTDKSSKVLEWTTDDKLAGHAMPPVELANEFHKTRLEYEDMCKLGHCSDSEIRKKLSEKHAKFAKFHPHLFFRVTDSTTTNEMLDTYKLMIAMRSKVIDGKIEKDSATNIVSDYVSKISVRDATAKELETGVVESTTKIKPYLVEEGKDPLNAAPGKTPSFISSSSDTKTIKKDEEKNTVTVDDYKEIEKEEKQEKLKEEFNSTLTKVMKKVYNSESVESFKEGMTILSASPVKKISDLCSIFEHLRKKIWWCKECDDIADILLSKNITL